MTICGIVTIATGLAVAEDNILIGIAEQDPTVKEDELVNGFKFMIGCTAALIIFVSVLGCCSGHLRSKICLGIYGFFALVIMALMFVYGAITLGVA